MHNKLKLKVLFILILTVVAIYLFYPPFDVHSPDGQLIKKGKINLGLDLQGGMHVVLQVDTSKMSSKEAADASKRALEIIRNRIDEFGVTEPSINLQGKDRLVIQLPGITDRERAISLLKRAAHLEFKLVSDNPEDLKNALDGNIPEGYELMELDNSKILVKKEAEMTGSTLIDAIVSFSQRTFGEPYISLNFNSKGARLFADVTGANVGKRLAIVLDGKVHTAPVIKEKIPSGEAQITGNFSVEEANEIAIVLRSGALPAPVSVIEERTVGPSLGQDSIRKGITAVIIGGIAVIVFMLAYYLLAGVIANIALLLNMTFILASLACLKATLTLPGIAGLVLTLGMAVDGNVLIFERIREELAAGKNIKGAVSAGFQKAFLAILDSNITTLITALILFQFGTGPIRGFATTLSLGIISSVFCTVFVTRVILDLLVSNNVISTLKMNQLFKNPKFDFVGIKVRRIAYAISIIAISIGILVFAAKGEKNYGIDFTGGTLQQVEFKQPIEVEKIRQALGELKIGDLPIQQIGTNKKEFVIRSLKEAPDTIIQKFNEKFGKDSFSIIRVESVGPAVGEDLKGSSIKALLFALFAMCIYIAMRFEFKFAIAAIIALFHDALFSVGMLSIFGKEISLSVIAAILTIVGYSINDTIVIFDRIREDRKLIRKADFQTIVNLSVNQTLSRTVLTFFTTMFSVVALFLFGGEVLNGFSFVLLVGMISGVYSTVFVASALLITWKRKARV